MAIWHPTAVPAAAAVPKAAAPAPSAPKIDTSHWPKGEPIDNESCETMLGRIADVDWEVQEAFYSTAMLLLRNILDKPTEPKFRSIKTDNAKIKSKVLDLGGPDDHDHGGPGDHDHGGPDDHDHGGTGDHDHGGPDDELRGPDDHDHGGPDDELRGPDDHDHGGPDDHDHGG